MGEPMKGTGYRFFACKGHELDETDPSTGKAIAVGGAAAFIVLGVHWIYDEGHARTDSCRVPGLPEPWFCLERISDGARRDIPAKVLRRTPIEPLNAMEVLARVNREHGMAPPETG